MNFICANGKIIPATAPVWQADNRGYRYGDGLFETLRVVNGRINLQDFHFDRFFAALTTLNFPVPALFTPQKLAASISRLCEKNQCTAAARVRLSASRGNGGLYDTSTRFHYLIECWPLPPSVSELNQNGLVIGIYPDARKSCDRFSNLKSANFLPYVMAAEYAKEKKWNDCLVLNTHARVADTTIANLFLLKNGTIITPAPDQGCVLGVMRRYLLEKLSLPGSAYTIKETSINEQDIETADEVFLTNAIYGMRWVQQFGNTSYGNIHIQKIYSQFIAPLFS